MPNPTKGRTSSLLGRTGAVVFVVVAVVVGMLLSTALASTGASPKVHRVARKTKLAVFLHHSKLARIASNASLTPPAGATLVAVTDGTEIYALQKADDEDCVIHLTAGEGGGSVCAAASKVEAEGEIGFGGSGFTASGAVANLRVTALVPNGVTSLRFTDRSGSSYDVPVTNNVAEHEDGEVASVSYTLPDGGTHTTNVAGVIDQLPRQPSAAG
jgi:uncharacterized membrane protein